MDGNGRWAQERGLPRTAGHERGEAVLMDAVCGSIEVGVKWLSAYAFSTENWKRSPDEVRFLMGFNRDVIRRRRDEMHEMGVRVRWAGRRPRLWRSVIKELEIAEELTKDNDVMTLVMCVNYGGRAEIADAVREIARRVAAGEIDPEKVTEATVARHLDEPDMPDVDLFLRPSGEQRISNFLLWQSLTPKWCSRTRTFPTSTDVTSGQPASNTLPRSSVRGCEMTAFRERIAGLLAPFVDLRTSQRTATTPLDSITVPSRSRHRWSPSPRGSTSCRSPGSLAGTSRSATTCATGCVGLRRHPVRVGASDRTRRGGRRRPALLLPHHGTRRHSAHDDAPAGSRRRRERSRGGRHLDRFCRRDEMTGQSSASAQSLHVPKISMV